MIAGYDELAPGFADSVLHRQVLGPHEMQEEWGLIGGNIFHGELSAEQLFHMRPGAGLRGLPDPDPGALPMFERHPRRRRRHGHPRLQLRPRDRARPSPGGSPHQRRPGRNLRAMEALGGKLLDLERALFDPNFRRTVVLIGHHDDEGAVGVILNRPLQVSVDEAVPRSPTW